MLLGALSALMLAAAPASAIAGGGTLPPCHEASLTGPAHHELPAPAGKTGKTTMMACCVSCIVTPAPLSPPRVPATYPDMPFAPVPARLPAGLSPAPEHGPPKA